MVAAAIPAAGAAWLLDRAAVREQHARVDDRLEYGVREGRRELERTLIEAGNRGAALAREPAFQRAFASGDGGALTKIVSGHGVVAVFRRGARVAGATPPNALLRTISLRRRGEAVGRIAIAVPIDGKLQEALARASGLPDGYEIALVRDLPAAGDDEFRARSATVPGAEGLTLVALAPERLLEAPLAAYRKRLYGGAGALVLLVALAAAALRRQISQAIGELGRLSHHATTDALTGVANRRTFDESLAEEIRRAERSGVPLSLILADVDDFKSINDRYGHCAGDAVLRRFADVIRESVRRIDLPARYGGEEFAVVLPGADENDARVIAERIRSGFATSAVDSESGRVTATASLGVALLAPGEASDTLIGSADLALYRAKAEGKNRVVAASEEAERAERAPAFLVERPAPS